MKKEIITTTVFISDDGIKFMTEEECLNHEKIFKDILDHVKYFTIRYNPDLTETGLMQSTINVAVYSYNYYHEEIVKEYCLREISHSLLIPGVQGYRFTPAFEVYKIEAKEFCCTPEKDARKLFLSPKDIEGFPVRYDYVEKWRFK